MIEDPHTSPVGGAWLSDASSNDDSHRPPDSPSGIVPAVSPILVQSRESFLHDLPELVATHDQQWVAYSGTQRLGIDAQSKTRLVQRCLREGHPRDSFLVCLIEREPATRINSVPFV